MSCSNRATTFLNSARNTCFCVVINTNVLPTKSNCLLTERTKRSLMQKNYFGTFFNLLKNHKNSALFRGLKTNLNCDFNLLEILSDRFDIKFEQFARKEHNSFKISWETSHFPLNGHTKCHMSSVFGAMHINSSRIVSYRINDFFDPTHFDRTTDFPHFGLCVRFTPTRPHAISLTVMFS